MLGPSLAAGCVWLGAAVLQGLGSPRTAGSPCESCICLPFVPGPCAPGTLAELGKAKLATIRGRIQYVTAFPDYKVQVVDAFPDLKVQIVTAFPDGPGKWQIVDAFPDFKIQLVESFPDFTVRFVDAFPGTE
jgi:hypothetical protein